MLSSRCTRRGHPVRDRTGLELNLSFGCYTVAECGVESSSRGDPPASAGWGRILRLWDSTLKLVVGFVAFAFLPGVSHNDDAYKER